MTKEAVLQIPQPISSRIGYQLEAQEIIVAREQNKRRLISESVVYQDKKRGSHKEDGSSVAIGVVLAGNRVIYQSPGFSMERYKRSQKRKTMRAAREAISA